MSRSAQEYRDAARDSLESGRVLDANEGWDDFRAYDATSGEEIKGVVRCRLSDSTLWLYVPTDPDVDTREVNRPFVPTHIRNGETWRSCMPAAA